jgi:aldehyde dehydrogenase (NAD+)
MQQRGAVLVAAAAALDARAGEVAEEMSREMGKPLRESRGEVARAAAILRYVAGAGLRPDGERFESSSGGRVWTQRRPVGVAAVIAPWNFPIAIPVWKTAPALVYGNAVVLKLAESAPRTGLRLAEVFDEAGLPAGVLNVLTGQGSVMGDALVEHPAVRAVSFTGSVPTGHRVRERATRLGRRVQLELGGSSPLVVTAEADLDRAVEAAFVGAFGGAGQKCTATRRIYVQAAVLDDFRERLLARLAAAQFGDPLDPATEVGPIVTERQMDGVLEAIERGRAEGGTVIAGGQRAERDGWFVEPTLFEGVADDAYLSCQEVFGPVAALYGYDELDEAIDRAADVEFGLSAAIFTSELGAARRFAERLPAGMLHVNSPTTGADVHVPFGGVKGSSWGPHEQGESARDFFTDELTVYEDV